MIVSGSTVEVTGRGWAITLPDGFEEEDAPADSRTFVSAGSSRLDALTVNVAPVRLDGPFAEFLRQSALAQAQSGMLASPARRLRVGETEVAEVDVTPRERTLSLRVFVRAEARGALGAVVTCTATAHNLALASPLCEAIRSSLHVGPERLSAAPPTIIAHRWAGDAGRWVSLPLEWVDQGTTAPQIAAARSPYADGEAVSAVLLSPEFVHNPTEFVAEAERSMSQGHRVENRRASAENGATRVDFEVSRERPLSPTQYRQRYAAHHGQLVIVTCGASESVFARRGAECDAILRSLRLGP